MNPVILDKPSDVILSSSLPDIKVSCEAEYVDVALLRDSRHEVIAERYYPADGLVTLLCYSQIIEDDLLARGLSVGDYKLTVTAPGTEALVDVCWFTAIYCTRRLHGGSTADFLAGNFLLSSSVRRIAPGADIDLPLFACDGEPDVRTLYYKASVKGSGVALSGELSDSDFGTFQDTAFYSYHYSFDDIAKRIATQSSLRPGEIVLHSLTVHVGARSCTFFIDHSLDPCSGCFFFRNDFNVLESIYLPMTSVRKVKTDLSIASVNESSVPYDRSTSVTVQVEAGPLSFSEREAVQSFLSSHQVYAPISADDGSMELLPSIISEYTCDISDDSEKLNTVKFKWQLADDRPPLIRYGSGKIFSVQFNQVFA